MRTLLHVGAALAALCSQSLPAQHHDAAPPAKTIVQVAAANPSFSTLVAALEAAGLVDALSGAGPFTVFAPTDEAFGKLGKDAIADLLKPENKERLGAILKYHVVAGDLRADKVVESKRLVTLQGQKLGVHANKNGVRVGGANVVTTDVLASNGTIHVIDKVLVPELSAKPLANLVETAKGAGSFATLLKAAVAAGLADTLANDGPFTVFAPTDAAFARLPAGTVENLLKPENKNQLAAILKYHVVAGRVLAADAKKLDRAKTLLGQEVAIDKAGDKLLVGGATVTAADVLAENGVIHVVDTVLLPMRQ